MAKHGLSGSSLASRGSLSDQGSQDQRQGRIFIGITTTIIVGRLKNILFSGCLLHLALSLLCALGPRSSWVSFLLSFNVDIQKWPKSDQNWSTWFVYLSIEFKQMMFFLFHLKFCCPTESDHQGWLSQAPSKAYLTTSGKLRTVVFQFLLRFYTHITKELCISASFWIEFGSKE